MLTPKTLELHYIYWKRQQGLSVYRLSILRLEELLRQVSRRYVLAESWLTDSWISWCCSHDAFGLWWRCAVSIQGVCPFCELTYCILLKSLSVLVSSMSVLHSSRSGMSTRKIYADSSGFYFSLVTPLNGLVPLSRPYVSSSISHNTSVVDYYI